MFISGDILVFDNCHLFPSLVLDILFESLLSQEISTMNFTIGCAPFLHKVLNGEDDIISNHSFNKFIAPFSQLWESYKLTDLVNNICQLANQTRNSISPVLPNATVNDEDDSNFESSQSAASSCSANR